MTRIVLLGLLMVSLQFCTYSQSSKNTTMQADKKEPGVLQHRHHAGGNKQRRMEKKSCRQMCMPLPGSKARNAPGAASTRPLKIRARTIAPFAATAFLCPTPSSKAACGWPSFYQPVSKSSIIYKPDNSHGMKRTEVECGRCKSHLGHVFDDGPPPTGLRYCINGVVLDF
jgi:peptide-methionine (R)-S-oxide reductase